MSVEGARAEGKAPKGREVVNWRRFIITALLLATAAWGQSGTGTVHGDSTNINQNIINDGTLYVSEKSEPKEFCPDGYRCDADGTAHRCGLWESVNKDGAPVIWHGECEPRNDSCIRVHLQDGRSITLSDRCAIEPGDMQMGKSYNTYSRAIIDPKCPKNLPWRVETVVEVEGGRLVKLEPWATPGHNCSRYAP